MSLHLDKCKEIHERLKSGWRPFDIVSVENRLVYSPERKFRKTLLFANSVEYVASEYLCAKKITDSMRQEFTSKVRGFVTWLKSRRLDDTLIGLIGNPIILEFFSISD